MKPDDEQRELARMLKEARDLLAQNGGFTVWEYRKEAEALGLIPPLHLKLVRGPPCVSPRSCQEPVLTVL